MYTREVQYTDKDKDPNKLKYQYSLENNLILVKYDYRYIRENDYKYATYMNVRVKEHLMILPIGDITESPSIRSKIKNFIKQPFIRWELYRIEELRSKTGYYCIRNPKKNQSIPLVYHKHLLKI